MHDLPALFTRLDLQSATIANAASVERRLSSLRGAFADPAAFAAALAVGDPIVYTVAAVEPGSGEGDLHYGLGMLMPGRVGNEYYLTKGHLHAWRPASEVYIGLTGEGMMLLEDEATGRSELVPLVPNGVVYVPGSTAHRTINTGDVPLVYLGVYPARAGHDYGSIAERNFRKVLVAHRGMPTLMDREKYLGTLNTETRGHREVSG